jgi:hypothetical protein
MQPGFATRHAPPLPIWSLPPSKPVPLVLNLFVRPSDDHSEIPSSVILLTEELHQEQKSINFF